MRESGRDNDPSTDNGRRKAPVKLRDEIFGEFLTAASRTNLVAMLQVMMLRRFTVLEDL